MLRLEHAAFDRKSRRAGWQAPGDISLTVRAGEIVGLAGIMGAGRTELLTALYGASGPGTWSGVVEIGARRRALVSIRGARAEGLGFVTDDRRGSGLMLRDRVGRNLVLTCSGAFRRSFSCRARARRSWRAGRSARSTCARALPEVAGRRALRRQPAEGRVREGGARRPRLLLLDEPTRGVDVGAKGEIYARIRALAGQGLGVLIASSEMPELIGLCDRVVVLRRGPHDRRIRRRRR